MMEIIGYNFNSIIIAAVVIFAIAMLRNSMGRLQDIVFSLTLIGGGYLSVSTFFPNDVPQVLGTDGMKVMAAIAIIVLLSQWEGNQLQIKFLRFVIIGFSILSLYQLIVVGFMFNGTPPTPQAWSLRLQANSDSYTAFILFVGGVFALGSIYLFTRRSFTHIQKNINQSKSENYNENKEVSFKDHDIKNTNITQTIPQVAMVTISSQKAPIYRTPSRPTEKFVSYGKEFRALGRTGDSGMVYLINTNGQAFWTLRQHVQFNSGGPDQLPVLEAHSAV